ncbi:hypothetical protein FRB99_008640 [Tulasnella sp. 403]|nr:hypothetical protein FRB99_008640 [Tulasnella sp. 403]
MPNPAVKVAATTGSSSSRTLATSAARPIPRYIDIGVNLTDPVFRGRGGRIGGSHPDDFEDMLQRSRTAGVRSMIITGGSLRESREALKIAKHYGLFATVGCHPTRSTDFDKFNGGPNAYLRALDKLIADNKEGPGRVVAVGECGLDYDRLFRAPAETQRKYFRMQLGLAKKHGLPLFLHSRNTGGDFARILREEGFGEDGGRAVGGKGGVVHSFTGDKAELEELLAMGFHYSLNGCGLKTAENLQVAAEAPLGQLHLETDAPWCGMKPTQASNAHLKTLPKALSDIYFPPATKEYTPGNMIKGRNEPNAVGGVAWVIARLKGVRLEEVTEAVWKNTVELFGLDEPLEIGGLVEKEVKKAPEVPSFDSSSFPALA